jgi:hypothetical protein
MTYIGPGDLNDVDDLDEWRERVASNLSDIGYAILGLHSELDDLASRLDGLASEIEKLRSSKAVGDDPTPSE